MDPKNNKNSQLVTIPGAIIIAAAIIAIALIYVLKPAKSPTAVTNNANSQPTAAAMAPVTSADHILGNPDAPIKIVEYSDPSCPYCKQFNPTMEQVMTAYGAGGQVAWVYRQFPLDKPNANGDILHPNSGAQAEGLECAASLGGNTAFWAYEKEWYSDSPSDIASESPTANSQEMAKVAKTVGLDATAFNDCVTSNQFQNKIDAEYTDGINAGVSGTPYSVIITPSDTNIAMPGMTSYSTLKMSIDTLLSGTATTTGSY